MTAAGVAEGEGPGSPAAVSARIRGVLARVARLAAPVSALSDEGDLHEAGLSSFAAVELMLALEEEFGVEFPEDLISWARFGSIAAIGDTVRLLSER